MGVYRVYIIFLIPAQKQRLWVLVRTAVLTSTHNLCFEQKYQSLLSEKFQFLVVKFSVYLNRRVFVMYCVIYEPQRQKTYFRTFAPAKIQIILRIHTN